MGQEILKNYTKELSSNNLVKDGLLELRLEQLRISGRAIGHGNFVNNLIYDFSRELEFQAIKYTESVILNTKNNQKKAKEQINIMIIYFIVIFFITLSINSQHFLLSFPQVFSKVLKCIKKEKPQKEPKDGRIFFRDTKLAKVFLRLY